MRYFIAKNLEMKTIMNAIHRAFNGIEGFSSYNMPRMLVRHAKDNPPSSFVRQSYAVVHELLEIIPTLSCLELQPLVLRANGEQLINVLGIGGHCLHVSLVMP